MRAKCYYLTSLIRRLRFWKFKYLLKAKHLIRGLCLPPERTPFLFRKQTTQNFPKQEFSNQTNNNWMFYKRLVTPFTHRNIFTLKSILSEIILLWLEFLYNTPHLLYFQPFFIFLFWANLLKTAYCSIIPVLQPFLWTVELSSVKASHLQQCHLVLFICLSLTISSPPFLPWLLLYC